MKIIHVIPSLNIGGAENFVVQLASEQVKHNSVSIILLGYTDPERNFKGSVHPAVKIFDLNWEKKYTSNQFWELYRLISHIEPDVLHFHLTQAMIYMHGIALIKTKVKYVHTVHNSYSNWKRRLTWLNRLQHFMRTKVLHVCISPSIHRDVQKGFPKLRSTMIRNGIKSYTIQRTTHKIEDIWNKYSVTPEKGKRFVTIGNISKYKNHKLLALSFAVIAKKYPNAMCIHFGRPSHTELVKEVKKINAPNLFFAGPHQNAPDFLSKADAMIISSIQEGMPIVALEALSMGIPIITTPAGGMVDVVIDNYNGFITPDFEVNSLINTITKYIELSDHQKKELSRNAKESFSQYYEINQIEQTYQYHYMS
ncbi:glycosyltransferase family 4 protein [Aquimarina pacifica]|uniref:glycosyltransferase family 4 protein n=1 Tax=Aquimarina pacifica TaxID=1296415 RepID=UPI00046F817B|nr:glycosyltransferase family 4 protein [Aquimarina pacifica]